MKNRNQGSAVTLCHSPDHTLSRRLPATSIISQTRLYEYGKARTTHTGCAVLGFSLFYIPSCVTLPIVLFLMTQQLPMGSSQVRFIVAASENSEKIEHLDRRRIKE